MAETEHSIYGGSQTHIYMHCPGSIELGRNVKSTSSLAALEGTDAHQLGEICLRNGDDAYAHVGEVMDNDNVVTDEMADAVQVYLDTIREDHKRGDKLLIEERFHLSDIEEEAFGTADCVIYRPRTNKLTVYDYKHGAGVSVEVEDNPQLLFYALGAMSNMDIWPDEIEVVIVQPRIPHSDGVVRRWATDTLYLLDWAEDLRAAIEASKKEDAPLVPGDWCKFCDAAGKCSAIHNKALSLAKMEFSEVNKTDYSKEELSKCLGWLPAMESWIKNVRQFAYDEAMSGVEIPGYKLVSKIGRRALAKDVEIKDVLKSFPYLKRKDITVTKLKGLGELEKQIKAANPGRKKADNEKRKEELEKFNDLTEKNSSGNVLVPESDKRPAILIAKPEDEFTLIE